METNIAPGLRFAILDHEFKLRLAERANKMDLTVSQLRVLGELSRLKSEGVEEINMRNFIGYIGGLLLFVKGIYQ